ncbi:hypothetical protein IH970_11015 [candidate division KSB1 bacterium]|nr:hypothetical protein [candidate division KSB1 bacterium]
MANKTQEWEEIVVKKGDYDDDDSYEEVYPVEDYLKQDYLKKAYPDDYQDYPAGYPTEEYPTGKYPGDYFPKVLQDWCRRQNTARCHTNRRQP